MHLRRDLLFAAFRVVVEVGICTYLSKQSQAMLISGGLHADLQYHPYRRHMSHWLSLWGVQQRVCGIDLRDKRNSRVQTIRLCSRADLFERFFESSPAEHFYISCSWSQGLPSNDLAPHQKSVTRKSYPPIIHHTIPCHGTLSNGIINHLHLY